MEAVVAGCLAGGALNGENCREGLLKVKACLEGGAQSCEGVPQPARSCEGYCCATCCDTCATCCAGLSPASTNALCYHCDCDGWVTVGHKPCSLITCADRVQRPGPNQYSLDCSALEPLLGFALFHDRWLECEIAVPVLAPLWRQVGKLSRCLTGGCHAATATARRAYRVHAGPAQPASPQQPAMDRAAPVHHVPDGWTGAPAPPVQSGRLETVQL